MIMSLWSVLWSLRCGSILRTRVLQGFNLTLRLPDSLSLRGVPLPGLARLLVIHSLSDVRCGVQIAVMGDTTG